MAIKYVANFAELKSAIEDSVTTEIEATADITFVSGGARVNTSKSNIAINFAGHNVTDNNTSTFTDTIYVASTTNTITVNVKNAIWSGRNYYGIVGVYDGNTNTTINISNITYTGPQFSYNKNGVTKITNCNINLERNNSSTNPQEMSEANRLTIDGKVIVRAQTTSNAIIWFTNANSALRVLDGATFDVQCLNTYLMYTDSQPAITIGKNANVKINTLNGLFYASGTTSHIASSFLLDEGGTFEATQTNSNSAPMFKCVSNLSVLNGATFKLLSTSAGSTPLIYMAKTATINFTNPKSVVLYNNGAKVFNFQTGSTSEPNKITINSEICNMWATATKPYASAGGLDDTPTKSYFKRNYNENVTATISTTNSQVTALTTNLVEGDGGYPVTASTSIFMTAQVISMGNILLNINPISDISTSVTGSTEPTANIRMMISGSTINSVSSESGAIDVKLSNSVAVGETINIQSNKNFLTKKINLISVGSVSIISVDTLEFLSAIVPNNIELIGRKNDDWFIEIKDTRTTGGEWYLYAHILEPLHNGLNTIVDGIILKENNSTIVISAIPTLVYSGKWGNPPVITKVSWSAIEGFLLKLEKNKEYIAGNYSTNIYWEVTETKK